jgi:nicotinamide phosphoribosyltransferase
MKLFPPHLTDFYKTGHLRQYPNGTEFVYSNFTPRSDHLANLLKGYDHKVVHFGLQGVCQWLLRDLWTDNFFHMSRDEAMAKYKRRMDLALGEGAVDCKHIGELHELGYLPVLVKGLPEGSRVPIRIANWTIQNTHPDFYWVTNYLETQLSAECWKSMTSATVAYEYRRLLNVYAAMTGTDPGFVNWQGHDFSFRGMSGVHDAAQSGAGHLLSFMGTDTIAALDYVDEYYKGNETFLGGSVPATEHSVMCMGGKDGEYETFKRLATEIYPSGIVSIVSDTWDFWEVLTKFSKDLKVEILGRATDALGMAKVVFRPDSGDPVKIICGDPEAPEGSPAKKGAVQCLWDIYGGTQTDTGHKLLNQRVGLIYGDSITLSRADQILEGLYKQGFASGNIVFGVGSFTYQYVTRDTFGSAIKATFGTVNGENRELIKTPKTDSGMKNSACGLLRIEYENGNFVQYDRQTIEQEQKGLLETIFNNGKMMKYESFKDIRHRLHPETF